jgi:hypothetical protein
MLRRNTADGDIQMETAREIGTRMSGIRAERRVKDWDHSIRVRCRDTRLKHAGMRKPKARRFSENGLYVPQSYHGE